MPSFTLHLGISPAILDQYDGFILDQYGVMHNGSQSLPGVVDVIHTLVRHGKRLVILSNSASLADPTLQRLPRFGLDPAHFVTAVTSGQEAAQYICATYGSASSRATRSASAEEPKSRSRSPSSVVKALRASPWSGSRPQCNALFFTWSNASIQAKSTSAGVVAKEPTPQDFLNACGDIGVTLDPLQADVIILHGTEVMRGPCGEGLQCEEVSLGNLMYDGTDWSGLDPILEICLARQVPLICCNPDFIVVKPNGTTAYMPGTIAARYEQIGGSVKLFGKPQVQHFETCIDVLQQEFQIPRHRMVHVGDSIHHDIAGANAAGLDSIFVMGGIHQQELPPTLELPATSSEKSELVQRLQQFFLQHKETPTHVIPRLSLA
jgi:ribonucleotide monophosphatase NagD (HAD superfamily)